ncbi:PspC domain-containing protein [Corynebacterium halotolerans]|uniref:PspC domain-containing protein n=1 Tax=Corynebacterium halotolerans TaxID=225326 RepID=UPI003CF0AD26
MNTLTQMWETRPPRIPSEQGGHGHVAGVCEGIAVRYQIDPTLVRISFVVLALFGGGVAAYIAAWLIMPRYGVPVAPVQALFKPEYRKERRQGWWLLIFFIIFSGVFGAGLNEFFGSTTLVALGLTALGWWGLHRKEPVPPAGLITPTQEQQMTQPMYPHQSQPTPDLSGITPAEGYNYPRGRTTPPAWDPLGTAPFAWDLPKPAPAQPPKRKARVWPWVALGFGSIVAVGALGVAAIFAVSNIDYQYDGGAVGDTSFSPVTADQLQDTYHGNIGETTVDLRGLEQLNAEEVVTVEGGVGQLEVWLPEAVPVELTCESGLGDSNCTTGSYNEDAPGAPLVLRIESGIGETIVNTE